MRTEKKARAGKTVTRISGLPAARLEPLAVQMRRALGCGAVIEGVDLILLGALQERAADWLRGAGASRVRRG